MLKAFVPSELGKLFEQHCDKAKDDFGRLDLLNIVAGLKNDKEAADTAVRVALLIANADGTFDDKEKGVVGEICGKLEIASSAYLG